MFNTKSRIGVKGGQILSHVEQRPTQSHIGRRAEQAFMSGGGGGGSNNTSMSTGAGATGKQMDLMLTGMLPSDNEAILRKMYMDMYYYDSVAGSAADLMSVMPFSDFSLVGLDQKLLDNYNSSIERLCLRTMLPEISLDYLVNGLYCSTLIFDNKTKSFTDSLPFHPGQIEVKPTPLYSRDPMIMVRPDLDMKQFFASTDDYAQKLKAQMPKKLVEALNSSQFSPDPMTTIYMPRRTFPHQYHGISYFKRLLPIYLLEKLMYRGTLVEASKRMRSILHVAAGIDGEWEPTSEEMNAITQMFQTADMDPLGAIVTTRNGVSPQEIRQGGDFWKYTDIIGDTTPIKLRSLGISEAFLSSDVNFSTSEVALSTFLESQRTYRDMATQKLFYQKLFPAVAVANGLFKDGVTRKSFDLGFAANDNTFLKIPEVRWHKSLQSTNDRDTFEMLEKLTEHGVPIPLRMWCAAGGIEVESLIRELQQDGEDRQRLEKMAKQAGAAGVDFGGKDSEDYDGDSGLKDSEGGEEAGFRSRVTGSGIKRIPLLARQFGDLSEAFTFSRTGKKKHVFRPVEANRRANEQIAKATANMSDPSYYQNITSKVSRRLNFGGYGASK